MNQHYVTENYLKQFTSENKVWSLDSNNNYYYKQYYTSKICSEQDLHTLQLKESFQYLKTANSNIIEESFWDFEKHYPNVVKDIQKSINQKNKRIYLSAKDKETIINMLIYNKIRHPEHRGKLLQHLTGNLTRNHIIAEAKRENIQVNTNNNKQSDLYNISLIDKFSYPTKILMSCYWELLVIRDDVNEFITSDSPGFTLLSDGKLLPLGGWGYQFSCYFPITPKLMLSIRNYSMEDDNKDILNFNIVNQDAIKYMNKNSYHTKHQYVYGKSKGSIINLKAMFT